MPWGTMSMSDLRLEFVRLALSGGVGIAELCRRFGVSGKTGHKWLGRYREEGEAGLADRSRRPAHSPRRSDPGVEAAVLEVRAEHPAWGGRKIARVLERRGLVSPSPSTVTAILRLSGIELGRHGGGHPPFQRFERAAPNELWQMDFKGHVGLGSGERLHPLTVLDDHSRFSVVLAACPNQRTETVRTHLVAAFRHYGLPLCIITDNGSPWGDGPGSPYTPLGVFLIEQGIAISHSRPYHPQTMGKDERFHRSLKAELLDRPPFADFAEAQRAMAGWRWLYNTERPHEGIGFAVPADRYQASPRAFVERIEPFDYAPGDIVRRVGDKGRLSYRGRLWRIPKALRGKTVALRPTTADGMFQVFFRHQHIADLDVRAKERDRETLTHVSEHLSPLSPV